MTVGGIRSFLVHVNDTREAAVLLPAVVASVREEAVRQW